MLVMIAACCLGGADGLCDQETVDQLLLGIAIGAGLILQILVVFIGDFRFGVPGVHCQSWL